MDFNILTSLGADAISKFESAPGKRLNRLTGNRDAEDSIRINQQWPVCFG
jgi:plasmid maintenance system killer protein